MAFGLEKLCVFMVLMVSTSGCEQVRDLVGSASSAGPAAASGATPLLPGERAAPTAYDPPPLTAGSFSRMRVTKNGQPDGEQILKVLAVTGAQVRIEVESNRTSAPRTIVNALVTVGDRRKPSSIDILEAQLKTGALPIMRLSGAQLKGTKDALYKQLDVFGFPDAAVEKRREDMTTPAGTFRACLVADQSATIQVPMLGPMTTRSKTWFHPSVAPNGVVRQESESGGDKFVYEVVETAATGAVSAL